MSVTVLGAVAPELKFEAVMARVEGLVKPPLAGLKITGPLAMLMVPIEPLGEEMVGVHWLAALLVQVTRARWLAPSESVIVKSVVKVSLTAADASKLAEMSMMPVGWAATDRLVRLMD